MFPLPLASDLPQCPRQYDRWVRTKVETSRADSRPAIADDEWPRIRSAKLAEREVIHGDKAV
jgi:hypothetical protein